MAGLSDDRIGYTLTDAGWHTAAQLERERIARQQRQIRELSEQKRKLRLTTDRSGKHESNTET